MRSFSLAPRGPFDLRNAREFFGGWPALPDDPTAVVMAFPVEGWRSSAVVVLRQRGRGRVTGDVYGLAREAERAWRQALATFSLDVDGREYPAIGRRDRVIGEIQRRYGTLRPTLFSSPYEAAAHFVLSHRRSVAQARATRARLAAEIGDAIGVGAATFRVFPRPQVLRKLRAFAGIDAERAVRLRGIAEAALDGILDRERLRDLPIDRALAELRAIRGIGEFFAQGILFRGAGIVDEVTSDEQLRLAMQRAYKMSKPPGQAEIRRIAERWRPYRMWAEVLLVLRLFREGGRRGLVSRPPGRRRTVDA